MDAAQARPLIYTGGSRFLEANEHFVQALLTASEKCEIHASEDIYDANGLKLWVRGKPVDARLLERLSNRKLRKPIELCVYAQDPVAAASLGDTIEQLAALAPDFAAAIVDRLPAVLDVAHGLVPNPTELLMISLMRHGEREMFQHAAAVTAIALSLGSHAALPLSAMRTLAQAAVLHDVGELYMPPELAPSLKRLSVSALRTRRSHPTLGGQVALELAHCNATVGALIATSHERLDGSGYAAGVRGDALSPAAQALLFAEAITHLLVSPNNGAHRAAVLVRIVPQEFPAAWVDLLVNWSRSRPVTPTGTRTPEEVGAGLRELHTHLARALVLLNMPLREADSVRSAASDWGRTVESMLWALRAAGVEDMLASGADLVAEDPKEAVELEALYTAIFDRLARLSSFVELRRVDDPKIGASSLATEFQEILASACPPDAQLKL